jgi:hypothetical protein
MAAGILDRIDCQFRNRRDEFFVALVMMINHFSLTPACSIFRES